MNSPKLIAASIFVHSPSKGTVVTGGACYTRSTGVELMSLHTYSSKSDILSHEYYRYSADSGRTWSEPELILASRKTEHGTLQRHARGGYVDPGTDRFLIIRNEAVLPNDEVEEFMRYNTVHYSLSTDGGTSILYDTPLIADGEEFNADRPLPNVVRGKNCFMLGDATCRPLTLRDGTILQPVQISPVGDDDFYHNPGGGFTFTDCAVLRGSWRDDLSIAWELGGVVKGDPAKSTRGVIEPTIARLIDGRILMVMRGSNDADHSLPGYKWFALSEDEGRSFTKAKPWSYEDGEPFYSPSACSQLLEHTNGEIYWIGNVCEENPRGNAPRYPIVIGRVDRGNGTLIKTSVTVIDDRKPTDGDFLTLSNFTAREDRESDHIMLYMCRSTRGDGAVFQGDLMLYEIGVD